MGKVLQHLAAGDGVEESVGKRIAVDFHIAGLVLNPPHGIGGGKVGGLAKVQSPALVAKVGQDGKEQAGTGTDVQNLFTPLQQKSDFGVTITAANENAPDSGVRVLEVVELACSPEGNQVTK
jgi:hypothetical protein